MDNKSENNIANGEFENPHVKYRGFPFWAWNSELKKDELEEQIEIFKSMGFGGFFMHVRQGLETRYLGNDFMDAVGVCAKKAKELGMYAFLYDEDRWPSGAGGGFVTANKMFRQKYLEMTCLDRSDSYPDEKSAAENGGCLFVAAFSVEKDKDGCMTSYRRIGREESAEDKRYFFIRVAPGNEPRYNYQSYTDTLNKDAMDEFIKITHEAYYKRFSHEFGKTMPAIFTDEPQTIRTVSLDSGFSKKDAHIAWTFDFAESFKEKYGYDITEKLPELFFAMKDGGGFKTRYDVRRHISERFCTAFTDNIGKWCSSHGIALTGHVLGEDSLGEMCLTHCDAMRTYKYMQIPGIDVLFDDKCFTTAVQCRSVVRQFGKSGMTSEMFGVTGWDFDFRGHKFQCDWQMCLGVTLRVPHLSWQTMKGEGKRDYPASIFYQSPWYKEYKYMEDYFARVCETLDKGKPVCRTAVIHPVETYWLLLSSKAESEPFCRELDEHFHELCRGLLTGGVDFDYIAESLIGDMNTSELPYDTVIVCDCITLRPETIEFLENFRKNGGKLIIMGKAPEMSLGVSSKDARSLSDLAVCIPFSLTELFFNIRPDVLILNESGIKTDNLLYTRKHTKKCDYLFVAQAKDFDVPHITRKQKISITVDGMYVPKLCDALDGSIKKVNCRVCDGKTVMYFTLCNSDSLLIKLTPSDKEYEYTAPDNKLLCKETELSSEVEIKTEEPNVLLLDRADFYLDGELVCRREEILRADNKIREKLGFDKRETKVVQPWAVAHEPEDHTVLMRFEFESDIDYSGALIALENGGKSKVMLDGISADTKPCGFYTDKNILTYALPPIKKGVNILEISLPFGVRTDLENCFVLGDFGVECVGEYAHITQKRKVFRYGTLTQQGYPFYGGNVGYSTEFTLKEESGVIIGATFWKGTFVKVFVDGKDVGNIAFAPYELTLNSLTAGKHTLKFVLYGNRYNTFSALHNLCAGRKRMYIGPIYWRSRGDNWSYEYRIQEFGILKKPTVKIINGDK